ncbi:MAG: transposase [Lysobacterales bacterium CG02_land_8_20_14_3_00_62_12]|nr:MAG: transposase [Xanthomonadales bacterium CG02_land_8_20_14_3_00_62_12]PJA37894.1 MAG: transposase [Xanthomonadales bacterium CG_4_9_14_3_um_filter_62_6]
MPIDTENPGYRALRAGRVSLHGQIYLVTTTTFERQARFKDADTASLLCRYLHLPGSFLDAKLLAWVLMPDHWHGLIELQQSSLPSVMRRFKSATARQINRQRGQQGRLWASGFHDHALRAEEALLGCARYLVLNPVRAGLVKRIGDYPYWNAIWL